MIRDLRIQVPGGSRIAIPHYPVDAVGLEERANSFTKRSIKNPGKIEALLTAISMCDLTTLEGADTDGKVRQLCERAKHPMDAEFEARIRREFAKMPHIPTVAAVCVYPSLVKTARNAVGDSGIEVASVATAFPSGQASMDVKLSDTRRAIRDGASEIDMVISREAFLSGNYQKVFDEIVAIKDACADKAHLKVILETGELKTYDKIRMASWLAMEAGGDFIKTSTGKAAVNATLPNTLVMLQAISDYYDATGRIVGMKPAGGIRTAKQAIQYLVMVNETLGSTWLTPDLFRFGASTLLNDLLRQVLKQVTGKYFYDDVFSQD